MRLLVADEFPDTFLDELRALGVEVRYRPELVRETLGAALDGVGILVVRSTEVTGQAIASAHDLNIIVRAGAVVDTIDVRAASARGIYVASCGAKNAIAVAELTFGLLLALDRRIPDATASVRAGKWERRQFSTADGLHGRRIGIAGLGGVGREVLARAKAFGMRPHAFSRSLSLARARELGVTHAGSLAKLAASSDVLSLHLALTPATRGAVDREVLEALPERAILLNTARTDLIDYDLLAEYVEKKGLRVGLDGGQSILAEHREAWTKLVSLPNVYVTPRIGAATREAQAAVAGEAVRIVRAFLVEGDVPGVLNVTAPSAARWQLVVRSLDRVGVLANVLGVIKRHGINIEEVSNHVFEGGGAACTKVRLVGRPSEACLAEIRAFSDEVLHVDLVQLPMRA